MCVAIIWPEIILGAEKKTEASKQSKLLHTRHLGFSALAVYGRAPEDFVTIPGIDDGDQNIASAQ